MIDIIKDKLTELEEVHRVRILYACESGSRAWGFKSPDSDFDVRFIYARGVNDYLSITETKDVIYMPVNDLLDIGGWDIKKALKLFLKSNSPLYEWLQSPIVYKDESGLAAELRQLMTEYYSLRAGCNHYLSMAINTVNNDLKGEEVKIKRYFYALRSALACKWIIEKQEVPPMEFDKLRPLVHDEAYQKSLDDLLVLKTVSDEKTLIRKAPMLDGWLQDTLEICKTKITELAPKQYTTEALNVIFRKYISQ